MPARSLIETHARLDRFVKTEMKRLGVPGAAVGILHRRGRHVNGYGVTNVDHPLPVDPDTLFQIGSTTKTYTATAMMRLVEAGKVDLNVPIRRYLPTLRLRNKEAERKVTLMHVFTHTGGWLGDLFEDHGRGADALAKVVDRIARAKHLTPLGQVWSYNNSGFYIAGRVIERITKQSYEDAIRELLFEPLELERSFWFAEEVLPFRVAVGHVTNRGKATVARPWALSRTSNPAGGIISDVGDQLLWAEFHMGDGKSRSGKRVLRKSSLKFMQSPHAPAGTMADSVGISWLLSKVDGHQLVAHGGTTNGQLSAFVMVPERGFAVTVLTNSTTGGQLHRAVVNWALENYLGIKRPEPKKMKVPHDRLLDYVGSYRVESSGQEFQVEARAGGLVVRLPAAPARNGKRAPAPPPVSMFFFDEDKAVATNGYFKGTRAEFLRSPRGKITWMRFGGRIHRRVPEGSKRR